MKKTPGNFLFLCGLMLVCSSSIGAAAGRDAVYDLTVELEKSPIGLDVAKPRFSWKIKPETGKHGQMQTAFRILVATKPELLKEGSADVFDSQKVSSDDCVLVDILKNPLNPRTNYHWTVKTWDETNAESDYATPERFDTGYFDQDEWKKDGAIWLESPLKPRRSEPVERWIRHAVVNIDGAMGSGRKIDGKSPPGDYDKFKKLVTDEEADTYANGMKMSMREQIWSGSLLRKDFTAGKIAQARLYISGLGYYRAYLNGRQIGERVLAPSETDFATNVYYNVYDVTEMITASRNCIGVELVTGRWWERPGNFVQTYYQRPVLIARLELTDSNGNVRTIVTDKSWQAGEHGILRQNFWIGELFDANLYPEGWNTPGFAGAKQWKAAIPAGKEPTGVLMRDPMPAERIVEYHKPVAITEPLPGVYVFDYGKYISGRARLKLANAAKGQEIVLRYSEIKAGDAPRPVPTALAWYPGFNNYRQLPGMLQFKRRGSVASNYDLSYGGKDGRPKGSIGSYQFGGGHLYTDMYVARGGREEVFEPKFSWTGFRYVEVLGLRQKPTVDTLNAFTLRTDPQFVGSMRTDNAKLNRVLAGTQASLMANYHSNYHDNAGAERNSFISNEGYTIDNSALWFNMYPQLNKVMTGLLARKEKYGFYPSLYTGTRHMDWFKDRYFHLSSSTSYPNLARGLVAYYNDQRVGREFALQLTDWVKELCEHVYWDHDLYKGSGEHQAETSVGLLPAEKRTRKEVISTPFMKAAWIMYAGHKAAALLNQMGKKEDAELIKGYLSAFNKRLFDDPHLKDHKLFDPESKTWDPEAYVRMGSDNLTFLGDLQPRKPDAELIANIAKEMKELGYMTIGVKSVYNLLSTVTQGGHADIAAAVLQREEYPGMLYSIAKSGGTVAEGWYHQDSYAQIEGLASVGNWFYRDLVGINPSISQPAFRRFELKPNVPGQVGSYNFTFDSPRGEIQSQWTEKAGKVNWTIVIPPNSEAEVHVPTKQKIALQPGMKFQRSENDRQVYEFTSGRYVISFDIMDRR
jgi:alpha-L-rhamnosidase